VKIPTLDACGLIEDMYATSEALYILCRKDGEQNILKTVDLKAWQTVRSCGTDLDLRSIAVADGIIYAGTRDGTILATARKEIR
jgi:hypothetical protein